MMHVAKDASPKSNANSRAMIALRADVVFSLESRINAPTLSLLMARAKFAFLPKMSPSATSDKSC